MTTCGLALLPPAPTSAPVHTDSVPKQSSSSFSGPPWLAHGNLAYLLSRSARPSCSGPLAALPLAARLSLRHTPRVASLAGGHACPPGRSSRALSRTLTLPLVSCTVCACLVPIRLQFALRHPHLWWIQSPHTGGTMSPGGTHPAGTQRPPLAALVSNPARAAPRLVPGGPLSGPLPRASGNNGASLPVLGSFPLIPNTFVLRRPPSSALASVWQCAAD